MASIRESVLAGLHQQLGGTVPTTVLRNAVLSERVPPEGLLILRDGEPGEPEVTLSPLRYHYQHQAEIEAVVQGDDRDSAFDTLTASIGATLTFENTGALSHNIEIPKLDVATETIQSGKTTTLTVTPEEPGSYENKCRVPGHAPAGMTGELVVAE